MIKLLKEKINNYRCKKYLKNCKHPEVESFGLNCDVNLWVEFNLEKLIRAITIDEITINNLGNVTLDEQAVVDNERAYALRKINHLKDNNMLDYNYMWVKK